MTPLNTELKVVRMTVCDYSLFDSLREPFAGVAVTSSGLDRVRYILYLLKQSEDIR